MEIGKVTGKFPELAVYRGPAAVEPLMPSESSTLRQLAADLLREAGALGAAVRPAIREQVGDLLRLTNSYYSHLIEGHYTSPIDIERAVGGQISRDPAKRDLQLENIAHISTQADLEARLQQEPELVPTDPEIIRWVHRVFYEKLPHEMWRVKTRSGNVAPVTPGAWRTGLVDVGAHVAPAPEVVAPMLARLDAGYRKLTDVSAVIAIAAMHHRLLWVHPFDDGNGRVARLISHAQVVRAGLDAGGLWSLARGLARRREDYRRTLADADQPRRNDLDGRGNLSARALTEFCAFFLATMLDQVRFMRDSLDFDSVVDRLHGYAVTSGKFGRDADLIALLLREAWMRGTFPRGDAARITGKSERTARDVLHKAMKAGLLASNNERGPVRMAFSVEMAESIFPRLYSTAGM